jgi:hypothetical protein
VKNVVEFSIADSPTTIWAGGKAGWFEMKPKSSYKDTYDLMSKGVMLYYFLCDIYEENKARKVKGGKSLDLDQIFKKVSQFLPIHCK